ncbi:hypothetical protein [Flavobacterium sp.]|uniref:hypothetical protein n=1 Tax=Flavobacterium sp. TaxID=239 RepID=UPI00262F55AB|nr:hypothetical protein [Flavobacterium sp.]
MLIDTALILKGFGAPFGALLISYGGIVSLTGTVVDLGNDIYKEKWPTEKFLTKTALQIIPSAKFGEKFFKYLDAENANHVLNAGTIFANRTLDFFEIQKLDYIEKIKMEDILTLLGFSIALAAYIYYSRKDFAEWNQLNPVQKFNLVRFPLLASAIVIMLFVKICFDL